MECSELRIGNWVDVLGKPTRVESIYDNLINVALKDDEFGDWQNIDGSGSYEPIELTPEILEAAGFVNDFDNKPKWIHTTVFNLPNGEFGVEHFIVWWDWEGGKVIYDRTFVYSLHQLQNLFYSLTGTELEINLPQ